MSSRISRAFYWQLASVSKDISSLYHFNYRSANHSVHGENLIQYLPPTWSHSVQKSLVCTTFTLTRSQHNTSRKSQHVISQGRRHSVIATYWRENYQWSSCYFRLISELVGFQLEYRRKNTISSIAQEQKPFPGPHLKNPRCLPATWSYYKGILVSYKHSQNHPNIPVYNWTHRLSLWLYFLCQDCT